MLLRNHRHYKMYYYLCRELSQLWGALHKHQAIKSSQQPCKIDCSLLLIFIYTRNEKIKSQSWSHMPRERWESNAPSISFRCVCWQETNPPPLPHDFGTTVGTTDACTISLFHMRHFQILQLTFTQFRVQSLGTSRTERAHPVVPWPEQRRRKPVSPLRQTHFEHCRLHSDQFGEVTRWYCWFLLNSWLRSTVRNSPLSPSFADPSSFCLSEVQFWDLITRFNVCQTPTLSTVTEAAPPPRRSQKHSDS